MNFQGPAIVHYEVYALNDQRWILHARFPRDEKDDALIEARTIESNLGMCAKVVRETYYPGNNASEEVLVYATDKNFRPRAQAPAYRPRALARGEPGPDAASAVLDFRAAASAKATRSMGWILKLLVALAAALTISAAGAAIVNAMVARLPSLVSPEMVPSLTFVVFVVLFLISGVPIAMSVVDVRDKKPADGGASDGSLFSPEPQDIFTGETRQADAPATESEMPAEQPAPPQEPPAPPETTAADAAQAAQSEAAPATAAEAPAGQAADPLESHRIVMIRFLGGLLTEVKKFRPSLDAFNIFGIDLMLAGALDVLGAQRQLDLEVKRTLLKDTIEVMGTRGETARAFADRYEDYLVEPKYMSMVLVGRSNMEALLNGADMVADQVVQAFVAWNKPQQPAPAALHITTVLFTDMVGSTDMTQAHGDHAAQEIVRRHNSIVRTALIEFSGKEIKHTGDGIMASFASASNGVEAAIAIQRACAKHNEKHADLPLHLRIGVNAGEPIEEEDDLFGSTVQLSARVCAEAGTDEILCTNVVRELSLGKDLSFAVKGETDLKGFKEPVTLYRVLWTTAAGGGPREKQSSA